MNHLAAWGRDARSGRMWRVSPGLWVLFWKLALDAVIVMACYAIALLLRFDGQIPQESWRWYLYLGPAIALGYLLANSLFGVYQAAWQYGGLRDVSVLAVAVGLATAVTFGVNFSFHHRPIPVSVNLISGALIFLAMGLLRVGPRLSAGNLLALLAGDSDARRVLIVGAGNTGQLLAREFLQNRRWQYRPVCFVDADPRKAGVRIHGVPVQGTAQDIPALVRRYGVDIVALAVPTLAGAELDGLLAICQAADVPVRIVPRLGDILSGKAQPGELREITMDDLLSRQPIDLDYGQCSQSVKDKAVLISGAAGSIGSELARQVLSFGPASLYLLDNNESGLHDLHLELLPSSGECELKVCIADVTDRPKVFRLFEACRPQVVFHAAAYKHVPLMEESPDEAFRVNVMGTLNVCQAAASAGIEKCVFISTDKAANPSSIMGATKRIGELLVAALSRDSDTIFCAVRFGNVIGSRGSVVPIFWRQIDRGGPISVTHPEVSRYFLTVPEAVSLIIQAAAFAQQGQIFMLDMGDEIRIVDLAAKMIRSKGRTVEDVGIVYTGLRPGEKLREDLVGEGERLVGTAHPKVLLMDSEWAQRCSGEELLADIRALDAGLREGVPDLAARIHALARLGCPGAGGHEGLP